MEIYVVQRGDTLYQIARRFSVPMDELVYANQLQNPETLSVGQALLIPRPEREHTVKRGETLYAIARLYGIPLNRLLAANPQISNPNLIQPGQRIRIPSAQENLGKLLVNGYISDASDSTLEATLPYLSFLSPFSYQVDARGNLSRDFRISPEISEGYGTLNLLTVTNLRPQGGFSSDIAHALFTDPQAEEQLLENLEALFAQGSYQGLGLDLEYIYPFDREAYNAFLARITERMHQLGHIVVTALAPKNSGSQQGLLYSAHDYAFHGRTADYMVLMTYEWGYTYGPAMAVSPLNKVRQVLDYAVSVIPAGKILMGVPNYGYNWTLPFRQGSAAQPISNQRAAALAGQARVEIFFDQTAQTPYFRYRDSAGKLHEVWFEDARSLRAKFLLADEYGLGGVSFWNLNTLFRTNFLLLESMFSVEKPR